MTPVEIPLRRHGRVVAHALIDEIDLSIVTPRRWTINNVGYAYAGTSAWVDGRIQARQILLHRAILGLERGDPREGDHINRDRLDNRRANLRICTRAENAQNLGAGRGASRFRGVSPLPGGGYKAEVRVNKRLHYLGTFATEIDAALAAETFRREHMPFAQPDPALAKAA